MLKPFGKLACLLAAMFVLAGGPRALANTAGAVVLVNSHSARYPDFAHFLQPYLGNFGVPYAVLDISSNAVDASLTNYALIIIGHAQLDTNRTYLTPAAQSNISLAVSNGVGLVNFDNALWSNSTAIYQFESDVFGVTYTNPVTSGDVVFPATESNGTAMHYITSLHGSNELLTLSNANNGTTMTVTGLKLATNDTAVATCGGAPFVVAAKHGAGRAVQWAGYDWMSSTIQGPMNGLDDLVWRGLVWAARKPFVMRGMPNFATVRIDDVMGYITTPGNPPLPLWWVHDLTNAGFKPFLALFYNDIQAQENNLHDGRTADLRNMVVSGNVTASIHAGSSTSSDFFYFNHTTESQWSDAQMSNNYVDGTQWLTNNGIPSSTAVIAHYSEMGTNSFNGLTNWGVQYVMIEVVPGTVEYVAPYAPWLVGGPYRLYETPQQGQVNMPMYYADWLTVPNHPELNGKFFDCYTEIRNVGDAGEWAPADNDVAGSITRGYQMLKRGFDSMTLGNMFTHEFFIQHADGPQSTPITTNHWQAILQGINSNIAPYHPIYVTLDYGFQYVRATRTSIITNADVDPNTGQITAGFTGYTDIPITAYYYTGVDRAITNVAGTVPVFTNSTNVTLGAVAVGPFPLFVSANNQSRPYGATNPVLTYAFSGFRGTDTVAVIGGSPAISTAAATNSPVGNYAIVVTNGTLSASNYTFGFSNGVLSVIPAALRVSADNQSRAYGRTNPVLSYSMSGFAGTDTVAVVTGSPAIATAADTNSAVGTYAITITNGNLGASNYALTFSNGTLTVTPVTLGVTADPKVRLYGATNPVFTASYSGFVNNETTAVLSGGPSLATAAATNSPVGDYTIAASQGGLSAANYTFSFTNGTLTVAPAPLLVSADNQARPYGATNPVLTYTISGFAGTDTVAVVSGLAGTSTGAGINSPFGTYPITITNINLSATNYNFTLSDGVLTIGQAVLLVSADNQSRAYGATNPALTYSISGFQGADTVAVVSGGAGTATAATTNSDVGAYPITVTNINLTATNYSFDFTNGTLTVNPVTLLVAADARSRVYGATNPALTYTMSGFMGTDTVAVVSGLAGTSTLADPGSGVGAYPIQVTNINLAASNYSFSFSNNWLTVTPAMLLVSADHKERPYGATNPALTYTMSGFAGTDTVAVVTGSAAASTPADTNSPVGLYAITVTNGDLSAANYVFAFSDGTLTVTATPPTILSISYDGGTNVLVTWSALSNATYRLYYLEDASMTNWQTMTPDVTATNNSASLTDHPGGAAARFYRVMVR